MKYKLIFILKINKLWQVKLLLTCSRYLCNAGSRLTSCFMSAVNKSIRLYSVISILLSFSSWFIMLHNCSNELGDSIKFWLKSCFFSQKFFSSTFDISTFIEKKNTRVVETKLVDKLSYMHWGLGRKAQTLLFIGDRYGNARVTKRGGDTVGKALYSACA